MYLKLAELFYQFSLENVRKYLFKISENGRKHWNHQEILFGFQEIFQKALAN